MPVRWAAPCSMTSRTKTAPVWSPVTSKPRPASGSLQRRLTVTGTDTGVEPSTTSESPGIDDGHSEQTTADWSDVINLGGLAGRSATSSTGAPSQPTISSEWSFRHSVTGAKRASVCGTGVHAGPRGRVRWTSGSEAARG